MSACSESYDVSLFDVLESAHSGNGSTKLMAARKGDSGSGSSNESRRAAVHV